MTKDLERLKEIKEEEGLSYETMAREIGVTFRTLYRWLKEGLNEPSPMAREMIRRFIEKREGG